MYILSTGASAIQIAVPEEDGGCMEASRVRVLVVDDYEPFRRFVCSTLRKRPEWQIVGEVSDGLEAVDQAVELHADLIVLDIGLPGLNGIEVARRVRKVMPECKVLFLSQESSADIVQEALRSGGSGYITKAHAARELLLAVDAVLQGEQFFGRGL
jgi:DNA-binding NarL/FixJ family response regulator